MVNKQNSDDLSWEIFIKRFTEFTEMLGNESERGSVIIASALMDEGLQQVIMAKLVPSAEKSDELFSGAYAPLDNFSSKIDFAYRIGLVSLRLRSILHIIRKLRNDFAHSIIQITFESQSVRSRIHELFKLNKSILEPIWEAVDKAHKPEILEIIGGYKSKHGFDYLVKISGWRPTFEILASIIAASLSLILKDIEPLVAKDDMVKS